MRIAGGILIILGFLISLSIVGAIVGIPMMLIGFVMVAVGGHRKTVITNVVQVSHNAPSPQLSLDHDDRFDQPRRIKEPPLRSGFSEPRIGNEPRVTMAQIPPVAEFEPTYDDVDFTDVRTELSQASKRILACAQQDGFKIKARPNSITLQKDDFEDVFRSNDALLEFGRTRGYY